jgi:hypothetical protein
MFEFSGGAQMGEKLFGTVTEATGLPSELVAKELEQLIASAGSDRANLTLDDLRAILAEYVQDVLLAAKEEQLKKAATK